MPVSGAFCDDEIMLNVKPGEHGSTYGGNLLPENAAGMGEVMRDELSKIKSSIISDQRGRGLFRGIYLRLALPLYMFKVMCALT
jgi:ornithine--oxo-acid transaminase